MITSISNTFPKDMLRIEYMIGNICNYKCNYCFPGSNEGDQPWPDIVLAKAHFYHLLKHYQSQGKTKFQLFVVGGETTVWSEFPEFCSFIKEHFDVTIEVSTNGSRSTNWWKKNGQFFDHVAISVHHEFVKIPHVVEVGDILYEKGVYVNADVLMDPINFDQCVSNIEQLKTSQHSWPIIAKIVHYDGHHRYDDSQLAYLEDNIKRYPTSQWHLSTTKKPDISITVRSNNEDIVTTDDGWLIKHNKQIFTGWQCNLGVEFIKIYGDGTITGNCHQHLYGLDYDYNLYDPNFVEKFKPEIKSVTCQQSLCGCNRETIIRKYRV
jgi:molybdenum cofactor biosynthesis enzyme MoaA